MQISAPSTGPHILGFDVIWIATILSAVATFASVLQKWGYSSGQFAGFPFRMLLRCVSSPTRRRHVIRVR